MVAFTTSAMRSRISVPHATGSRPRARACSATASRRSGPTASRYCSCTRRIFAARWSRLNRREGAAERILAEGRHRGPLAQRCTTKRSRLMSLPTSIAIYFIIWWVVLFAVLPWGVRSQQEHGAIVPGSDPGAPVMPALKRKLNKKSSRADNPAPKTQTRLDATLTARVLCCRSRRLRLHAGLFLPRLGPRGRWRWELASAPRPRLFDAIRSRWACHQSQTRLDDVKSPRAPCGAAWCPSPDALSRKVRRKALIALVFLAAIRFHSADPKETILPIPHAPLPLLPADPARDPEGSGGRLPPADVTRGPHPPRGRRDLRLAAARLSRAQEDRADRARGAGPRGGHRALDAHAAAGRSLARERTLRRLRPGNVAHQGSA